MSEVICIVMMVTLSRNNNSRGLVCVIASILQRVIHENQKSEKLTKINYSKTSNY
jgi:hypothetical protein